MHMSAMKAESVHASDPEDGRGVHAYAHAFACICTCICICMYMYACAHLDPEDGRARGGVGLEAYPEGHDQDGVDDEQSEGEVPVHLKL